MAPPTYNSICLSLASAIDDGERHKSVLSIIENIKLQSVASPDWEENSSGFSSLPKIRGGDGGARQAPTDFRTESHGRSRCEGNGERFSNDAPVAQTGALHLLRSEFPIHHQAAGGGSISRHAVVSPCDTADHGYPLSQSIEGASRGCQIDIFLSKNKLRGC